jgi:transcriptional regulator with GAF, ATPase, and Fis domain
LFLDEIGETSLAFQVKLLRVLQEGVYERVGGTKPVRVSVRVIGATNQNLQKQIAENRFRQDLFYRLNGFSLTLPPLRERPMDVEHLFRAFLAKQNCELKISEPLLVWLKSQRWQGNIRELKIATERAVLNASLRKRNFLLPEDFELSDESLSLSDSKSKDDLAEKVLQSLRKHEFKHRAISAVSTDLGIHRVTVTEYLRGWTARYLNEFEDAPEKIYAALKGETTVYNDAQFRERIDGYIDSIRAKIKEGLDAGESTSELKLSRFRALPNAFEKDILELCEKMKTKTTA